MTLMKTNTSGFRGVTLHTKRYTGVSKTTERVSVYVRKYWRANIWINGRLKCLGCFRDKISAAKAYNTWAKKYHNNPILNNV